jgi:hypothetical protein
MKGFLQNEPHPIHIEQVGNSSDSKNVHQTIFRITKLYLTQLKHRLVLHPQWPGRLEGFARRGERRGTIQSERLSWRSSSEGRGRRRRSVLHPKLHLLRTNLHSPLEGGVVVFFSFLPTSSSWKMRDICKDWRKFRRKMRTIHKNYVFPFGA